MMRLIKKHKRVSILFLLLVMIVLVLPVAHSFSAPQKSEDIKKTVTALLEELNLGISARDEMAVRNVFSPGYVNDSLKREKIAEVVSKLAASCKKLVYDCKVSKIIVTGDSAIVSYSGEKKADCGAAMKNCSCEIALRSLGAKHLCKTGGKWLFCGNGSTKTILEKGKLEPPGKPDPKTAKKPVALEASMQKGPGKEDFISFELADAADKIISAEVSGPGLPDHSPLVKEKAADGSTVWKFSSLAPGMIPENKKVAYKVTYKEKSGTHEIKKFFAPVTKYPLPVYPVGTAVVMTDKVKFTIKKIPGEKPSTRYEITVFSLSGNSVAHISIDKEIPPGVLKPNTTYLYRVSAIREDGATLMYDMESFRYKDETGGAFPKFVFTNPEKARYSGMKASNVMGVRIFYDKIILNDIGTGAVDILDRKTLAFKAAFKYNFGVSAFSPAPDRIYLNNTARKRIEMVAYNGNHIDFWKTDTGRRNGVFADDIKGNRFYINNSLKNQIEVYDYDRKLLSSFPAPAGMETFAADDEGRLYFSDRNGLINKYSADGKKLSSWTPPIEFTGKNLTLAFDAEGNVTQVFDYNFNPPASTTPVAVTLIARRGRVYAAFRQKDSCDVCGMLFDVDENGELMFANRFK